MSPPSGRVVVALRAGSDTRFLGEAGALARTMHAELAALFVEEVELIRLARLPIAREIGVASGSVLEFDPVAIARLHRQQADAIRAMVARTAHTLELSWTFEVARGSLLDVALGVLSAPDLLMVEPTPSAVQHALGRTAPRAAPAVRTVVNASDVAVLHEATSAGGRALEVALRLAGGRPEAIVLVVDDDADVGQVRRAAESVLDVPEGPSVITLAELGRGRCPRALVVPLERVRQAPSALRALRAAVSCPLVLVH